MRRIAIWQAMTWAQRLKRVFNIDIETCRECGGAVKGVACIEEPVVIKKILTHLQGTRHSNPAYRRPDTGGWGRVRQ
jgi:hypothetical protein